MEFKKDLVFYSFYVGDGDCTLVQFPGGYKYAVIDSNTPSWRRHSAAANILKKIRTRIGRAGEYSGRDPELAFVCVSHPHRDHISGLLEVLQVSGFDLREFWHPLPDVEELLMRHASAEKDDNYSKWTEISQFYYEEQVREFVESAQFAMRKVGRAGTRQLRGMQCLPDIEGVEIYVLNPTAKALAKYQEALDSKYGRLEHLERKLLDSISVALLFVYGENAFLYASDMQSEGWSEVVSEVRGRQAWKHLLPVDVAKASHHGGPKSFYKGLWDDVLGTEGKRIVVSGGSLVHPSSAFITSVRRSGKRLYCTGKGKSCGRRSRRKFRRLTFQTKRWFERNGIVLSEICDPCRGDIRVVLPEAGKPKIATTCKPDEENCKPEQTGVWAMA